MTFRTAVLEHALAYRLWQAPFAGRKLAPVFRQTEASSIRRVLDVGCGPGTNTGYFPHAEYLGIDVNERYIDSARRRHGRPFVVADATTYRVAGAERFDFILLNSFLHHVNDESAHRILSHLGALLTDDGHVHVLDLILPERRSLGRLLARWDRGRFVRSLAAWRGLLEDTFEPVVFEPYPLGVLGVTLWNMFYFKGRRRP